MTEVDTEILIVGAGPVGATLAGLLGSNGFDCLIIDAKEIGADTDHVDPRALAMTHASRQILSSFGAWSKLPEDRLGKIDEMVVWDENGTGKISFRASDIALSSLGYILEQSVLEKCLAELLNYLPAVTLQSQVRLENLLWENDCIRAELDDGQNIKAKLVVAADGSTSRSRNLAGILYTEHDYMQSALVCTIESEFTHENTARQRFLSGGPLAFLPMSNPHQSNIVWSTSPAHVNELLSMDPDDFKGVLQAAINNTLGKIEDVQHLKSFPLKRAFANDYCKDRFVLVGDSAHSIHPLAGQGANLGLLDVACLSEVLITARNQKRNIGAKSILRKYERWRKGGNQQMMFMMDGFKFLFEKQDAPLPFVRNYGMDVLNSMNSLKHFIMRRAMGLEGDLPNIARSRPN